MKTELTCIIDAEGEAVVLRRGNNPVGIISLGEDGEPEFMLYGNQNGTVFLSFSDIEIAMDNWNQMQEMRRLAEVAPLMKETLDRV
jgi:hypothetical protein